MRRILALASVLFACADVDAPAIDPALASVVYGDDDRLDHFEVSDADLLALADATVALMSTSDLTSVSGGRFQVDDGYTLDDSRGPLCGTEPFANQPTTAYCTGFLVTDQIVATAGHCVDSRSCNGTAFVFDYRMASASTLDNPVDANDVYTCASVLENTETSTVDFALVQLDRPVTGHTPMAVRTSGTPTVGQPLVMLGHPSGLPIKIAGGAEIKTVSPSGYLEANVDAYGGNSGSPVVNASTLEVEGILFSGETDYAYANGCWRSNTCSDANGCNGGFERITRADRFAYLIPGLGASPPACDDDGFEDNDTDTTATPLSPGVVTGLTICPNDDDFFSFEGDAGDALQVDVDFVDSVGDLDVRLYANGTLVDESESSSNGESVAHTATTATTWVVEVYGYQGAANTYALDVEIDTPAPCPVDAFEPNDSTGAAAELPLGETPGLGLCTGDEDWYAIDLTAGQELVVDVLFDHGDGDLDIRLLRNGQEVDVGESGNDDERVTVLAPSDGTYVLQVYGWRGATAPYALDVEVHDPPGPCTDDGFEDNDDAASATRATPGIASGLQVCVDDDDWFAIDLQAGEALTATLTFDHDVGDLDMALVVGGQTLDRSQGVTDLERLRYTAPTDLDAYVVVYGYRRFQNAYTLSLRRHDPSAPDLPPSDLPACDARSGDGLQRVDAFGDAATSATRWACDPGLPATTPGLGNVTR